MTPHPTDSTTANQVHPEAGQAAFSVVLMLSMFLFAIFGFSVDLTNIWFHRQASQAAADAACQAGAMDMLATAGGVSLPNMGFTPGSNGNCTTSSMATMCSYAALNGYAATGLLADAPSSLLSWTFPATVTGVTPGSGSHPFLQVTLSENVKTYFINLLKASHIQNINTVTTCGLAQVDEAAPMVVLNPTVSGAFYYSGGGALDIVGGPGRGLQVNSSSSTAITWLASAVIDLSKGGANQTGSDVGVVGGPTAAPTNGSSNGYSGGSTGVWRSSVLPVPDPFGNVGVPASIASQTPANSVNGKWVGYNQDGCPDHSSGYNGNSAQTCNEFSPGYYPAGINLPNIQQNYTTAIFKPGIYYLNGSLTADGSNTMRVAKPTGFQQTDGVMFFFLNGSFNVSGCSGCSSSTVDNVNSTDLTCDGSAPPAALNMPPTVFGNVLYAQCTSKGTYWDTGNDTADSRGTPGSRGLLFFQDHANTTQPQFVGSGALTFSGALYFHSSSYADVLSLNGGASSGTYVLGEIIADQVSLTGSGMIKLALNPSASTPVSKVAMF